MDQPLTAKASTSIVAGTGKAAYAPPSMRKGVERIAAGLDMRRREDDNSVRVTNLSNNTIDKGRRYFHMMKTREYNLSPKLEHYGCMIDLLCRAGLLDEALDLVKTMPFKPDVLICGAILSACKSRGTLMELPKEILDSFLEMEFEDSGGYVLLSNIFAANRRWNDVSRIRRLMKAKGMSKIPGSSAIEKLMT